MSYGNRDLISKLRNCFYFVQVVYSFTNESKHRHLAYSLIYLYLALFQLFTWKPTFLTIVSVYVIRHWCGLAPTEPQSSLHCVS